MTLAHRMRRAARVVAAPAVDPDPLWASVWLLAQLRTPESLDDASTRNNTLANYGGAVIDADGTYFDGIDDSVRIVGGSASLYLMTMSSWCIEMWIWPDADSTGSRSFFHQGTISGNNNLFAISYNESGSVTARIIPGDFFYSGVTATADGTITPGQWNHVAVRKNGTQLAVAANGVWMSPASTSFRSSGAVNQGDINIGAGKDGFYNYTRFKGRMRGVRMTIGTARYPGATPADFTPPAYPFPDYGP